MKKLNLITSESINKALGKKWPVDDALDPKSHYVADLENVNKVYFTYSEYCDVWNKFEDDVEIAKFVFERFPSIEEIHFQQGVIFTRANFESELAKYRAML